MDMNFVITINGREVVKKHNVVTTQGRDLIRKNIMEGGTARQLGWLHMGRMINPIANPIEPALNYDVFQTQWDGVNKVDGGLDLIYQVEEDELVGIIFNAAGVYTGQSGTDVMYALTTFDELTKTDEDLIIITWQLRWRSAY